MKNARVHWDRAIVGLTVFVAPAVAAAQSPTSSQLILPPPPQSATPQPASPQPAPPPTVTRYVWPPLDGARGGAATGKSTSAAPIGTGTYRYVDQPAATYAPSPTNVQQATVQQATLTTRPILQGVAAPASPCCPAPVVTAPPVAVTPAAPVVVGRPLVLTQSRPAGPLEATAYRLRTFFTTGRVRSLWAPRPTIVAPVTVPPNRGAPVVTTVPVK